MRLAIIPAICIALCLSSGIGHCQNKKNDTNFGDIDALEKASKESPSNADLHLYLAHAYNNVKEEDRAIEEFKSAIKFSKEETILVSAHLAIAAIYKRRGESSKADEEYESARKIYPGVDDMVKEAQINSITPSPKYCGEAFSEEGGMYPKLEARSENVRKELNNMAKAGK